jgi:hypothetical protein
MKKHLHQIVIIGLLIVGITAGILFKKQPVSQPAIQNDNWPQQTQPK